MSIIKLKNLAEKKVYEMPLPDKFISGKMINLKE